MPKRESELSSRVIEINREACHRRGLWTNYGYNAILDVNLVRFCQSLPEQFRPPIRVLDVGCGDGLALQQLAEGLVKAGADPNDFELWGMGLNRYDEMSIQPNRFIRSGLNDYRSDGTRFHLVVSVFTFHYMWHKLEGLEKIHNELLEDGGHAFLHFPGFLVRWGESPAAIAQTEATGNPVFADFLARREADDEIPHMQYRLVPYESEDDDCTLLAEFGNLRFRRQWDRPIAFRQTLKAFALFTQGFTFGRMNRGHLTYVASHYARSPEASDDAALPFPPYRITSVPVDISRRSLQIDVAIHAHESDSVILICPGACEPLAGRAIDFLAVAEEIRRAGLGAVVRQNDPYDHGGDYPQLILESLRRVLALILESAASFCASATPRIGVMAYSSSAGAIAALAADYPCIDAILLVAPSFDVPRDTILPGLRRFAGDVCVLIGDADNVVLPQQAFWFYERAEAARRREYVEVPSCGHDFEGNANRSVLIRSLQWAFGENRPEGFPPPRTTYVECV